MPTITSTPVKIVNELSDEHIKFISEFIYQRSGIVLGESKHYLIESRLKTVARVAGMESLSRLCEELSKHQPQLETLVLDALTTNETSWFRDNKPYEALEKIIFPHIQKTKTNQVLQIWSAACSSGQEPYSIAIKILESGLFKDWHIRIVATDISTQMLTQAKEGMYSQLEVSRGMPVKLLIKYFTQIGDVWKLKSDVCDLVTFKEHKLQNSPSILGTFDLVFCRNVLIYFDLQTKRTILEHLHGALTASGLLALGGSESTLNLSDKYEPVRLLNAVYYAKADTKHSWQNT